MELVVQALKVVSAENCDVENISKVVMIRSEALKAIRSCVVRNPSGRARCREAKVLQCLEEMLTGGVAGFSEDRKSALLLVEDIITTIAAVCLGDDINALQAAVATDIGALIDEISKKVDVEKDSTQQQSTLYQKITYLRALFENVVKEQEIGSGCDIGKFNLKELFDTLPIVEDAKQKGNEAFSKHRYEQAEAEYSKAIDIITCDDQILPLIRELAGTLHSNRSACRFENKNYENALSDSEFVLRYRPGWIKGFYRKSQALTALGRIDEAKEALGKGLVIEPGNEVLTKELHKFERSVLPKNEF